MQSPYGKDPIVWGSAFLGPLLSETPKSPQRVART